MKETDKRQIRWGKENRVKVRERERFGGDRMYIIGVLKSGRKVGEGGRKVYIII